jgi:thioredoxin-related protein
MKMFYGVLMLSLLALASCKDGEGAKVNDSEITWLAVENADKVSNKEGKRYFIDVYTEWCGWCKVMDKNTFTQPQVIKYMNENFHSVKFDAEMKERVTFNGETFDWQSMGRGGINGLALKFLGGDLSYPSYVILDAQKKPLLVMRGYMEADQFLGSLESAH